MKRPTGKALKKYACTALALGIGFCTAIGGSGCGFAFANTEEEMYEALKEATEDFLDYSKAITVEMDLKTVSTGTGSNVLSETTIKYSFDPKKKKMFAVADLQSTQGSQSVGGKVKTKLFEEDGEYYIYQSSFALGATVGTLDCYRVTPSYIEQACSVDFLSYLTEADLSQIEEIFSYDYEATKTAYETVYAEQLAERKETDANAIAEQDLALEKDGNSITLDFSTTVQTLSADQRYTVKKTEQERIVGEKGKLTELFTEQKISLTRRTSSTVSKSQNTTLSATIAYEFDEDGYDEVEAKAVGVPNGALSEYVGGMYGLTFNVGGCVSDRYATATGMLTSAKYLFNEMSKAFTKGGCTVEWYRDASYHTPLNLDELTAQKLKALETVYGKVTVLSDNYAVCAVDYELQDERSEAYKIVFGLAKATLNGAEELQVKSLANGTRYDFLPYGDYVHEIYVNGAKQESAATGFTMENKGFYHVKYLEKRTDSDCSLFELENYFS